MKKHFDKDEMTKEEDEYFENCTKYWICVNAYVDSDVKVRYHCHITGKYRCSAHKDCNIKIKLNHKIPIVFHCLKNYDSHLNMHAVDKFSFKINVISNGFKKYMSFNIGNKLILLIASNFYLLQ